MDALMARLVQRVLLDTRQQLAVAPKSTPLVDTRTIGKAPTFTGEHKDWPEWSFQFVAYMGSANPKSIDALGCVRRRPGHTRCCYAVEFR